GRSPFWDHTAGAFGVKGEAGKADKRGSRAFPGDAMTPPMTRRTALKAVAAGAATAALALAPSDAQARVTKGGAVVGAMTGARALVEALLAEGVSCVFGIPGAQENELWDEMKGRGLAYLLVTHEHSAACMADGAARSTGVPGVICIVPGPGVTNALTGIGEALLDSVPMVCIIGDVARGDKYKPFQLHEIPQAGLIREVTKGMFEVAEVGDIPGAVQQAFQLARQGEPGPTAVVVPYNLLTETHRFNCPPAGPPEVPFDEAAVDCALRLLGDRRLRVGVYAGMGCMDFAPSLVKVAELLQAPVATSVSGKGVIDECHPLAVGWGYGPQATCTAENAFKSVDLVLAIGVRYSEVSTGCYAIPPHRLIHVDANPNNIGRIVKPEVCVNADAGVFLEHVLAHADDVGRPCDAGLAGRIRAWKAAEAKERCRRYARCGADPMLFFLALRKAACPDALTFVDVTCAEHWAAEAYTVHQPRTYFNPTDNQAMGWAIPAALGAQRVHLGRQVVSVTGDGCFLMAAMEISTAARECLPVKFFVLDDQAYHYMQVLQEKAYRRTTATILARLDYAALARGFGVEYMEIDGDADLDGGVHTALDQAGPVLTRVVTDYGKRPIRWLEAVRNRYVADLTTEQKVRFLARLGSRALEFRPQND
ncbi:MAG TPA: thiamine pyrophosphate-binding protein, partial [Gemmataceae bacterium]|nr:thiamine pyrophosphate-binding protein [Gemmataceae bacterium]